MYLVMDLSCKEAKCFSIKEIFPLNSYPFSVSVTVSGIHRAVLENNLEAIKHLVEAGDSVNNKEEHYEFTPLHLTVIKNNVELLDYLLSREDIEVNARTRRNETPLQMASGLGAYESVKKLIAAGADVNLTNKYDVSPLHLSIQFPDICHILLQNGADVDAVDEDGVTPLLDTVNSWDLEVMYMLLYYNADPSIPDSDGITPLVSAIVRQITEAQHALLDYVVDFNDTRYSSRDHSSTILGMALQYGSPYVKEILDRGADLNYCDYWGDYGYDCSFLDCLYGVKDETIFKIVWERHRCHQISHPIDLCTLFDVLDTSMLGKIVQVIVESDNIGLAVDSFTENRNFHRFIRNFISSGLEVEQLVVFTYRLLEYGYRPTLLDVHNIFSECGPCELRRILLYIDIDYKYIQYPIPKISIRAMFDLDFDAGVLANEVASGEYQLTSDELVSVLEYFQDSHLVNVLWSKFSDNERISEILEGLPKVPSLMELARNQARKHICEKFKVANICQFYTIMDRLEIPSTYKSIITYSRKIYMVK